MAYQPLYATIDDGVGTRHTHSLRGRVDYISYWLNSQFGEVMRVNANSEGSLTGVTYNRICECNDKIKNFQEAGNEKKVLEWTEKLKQAEQEHAEAEKREAVFISVSLKDNEKFKFDVDGVEITRPLLNALRKNPEAVKELLLKLQELENLKEEPSLRD